MIEDGDYRFTVKAGLPPESAKNGTKSGGSGSANFQCRDVQSVPIASRLHAKLRGKSRAHGMLRLMAIVAEGDREPGLPSTYVRACGSIVQRADPMWTALGDRLCPNEPAMVLVCQDIWS